MPVGQVAREVVGTKDRHHAMRFVAQLCFSVRQRRLVKSPSAGDRPRWRSRPCRSSPALRCGSPTAACWSPREIRVASASLCVSSSAAKTLHHGNTLGQRPVRPGVKRRARRGAGRLDVVGTRAGRLPQQRLILRGQFAHRSRRCPPATARL